MLLEKARQHAEAIRLSGADAAEVALASGVPVYYIDDSVGEGIIKELPDRSRYRIAIEAGREIIIEAIPPRS